MGEPQFRPEGTRQGTKIYTQFHERTFGRLPTLEADIRNGNFLPEMKGHRSLGRFGKPRHVKTVKIHILNPLVDRRWDELVARHPGASVFHQRGWLEALARTYGYEPYVLTSASPGEPLKDGIVLDRVSSWITGCRLVSLPFSDHCDPLLDNPSDLRGFLDRLR